MVFTYVLGAILFFLLSAFFVGRQSNIENQDNCDPGMFVTLLVLSFFGYHFYVSH